jgi:hypothetical protein
MTATSMEDWKRLSPETPPPVLLRASQKPETPSSGPATGAAWM